MVRGGSGAAAAGYLNYAHLRILSKLSVSNEQAPTEGLCCARRGDRHHRDHRISAICWLQRNSQYQRNAGSELKRNLRTALSLDHQIYGQRRIGEHSQTQMKV